MNIRNNISEVLTRGGRTTSFDLFIKPEQLQIHFN